MRVVQASCFVDPEGREPDALLDAWPSLVAVASATARAGADVTVIQAAGRDHEILRDDVRFRFIAERAPSGLQRRLGPWSWPPPRRMAASLTVDRPAVLHVHGLGFTRQAALLASRTDARVLLQDHADHVPQGWKRPWQRAGFGRLDGVAFTATAQAEPFRASGLLRPETRVFAVPEASSAFSPGDASEARRRTGLHGDPCLLWLGRLDANKDPLAVLDALAIAARSLPGIRLWCCYRSAPLLDRVYSRINGDPALRDRVRLLGEHAHDRVETMLRAADFLVQGSHVEGSGYAVIEALACGTPPLVTDIPSFRALTADGRVGALTPPGDAKAMARSWIDWAARDRPATRMEARAHFDRELSFDALGRRLLSVYRELAA